MEQFARQFGARVKEARIERGLTQAELAVLAGVGANYVPRIERGEMTPSLDAACRIAEALGVSMDELTGTAVQPRKRMASGRRRRVDGKDTGT